jgi:site-specific DNA-cytosine methylase
MKAIDLFAGAGGFSTGARQAGVSVVWAANHWPAAVEIHRANHPETEHSCQDLQQADWTQVPGFDLLLASPACQGHSKARGAEKPHHDALRSTAWAVVSAIECHRPQAGLVENVPEFADWTLFPAWEAALKALGYSCGLHLVDAADHGVPQHRVRLLIAITRSKRPLMLELPKRPHVPVRGIIQWDHPGWSADPQAGPLARNPGAHPQRPQAVRRPLRDAVLLLRIWPHRPQPGPPHRHDHHEEPVGRGGRRAHAHVRQGGEPRRDGLPHRLRPAAGRDGRDVHAGQRHPSEDGRGRHRGAEGAGVIGEWTWTAQEWAYIERTARTEREARALVRSHTAAGIGGMRLANAKRDAKEAAMVLRGMARIAGSAFADDLIADFRRSMSATLGCAGSLSPLTNGSLRVSIVSIYNSTHGMSPDHRSKTMPGLMPTFDAMSDDDQTLVRKISNAARQAMERKGVLPRNDDAAARFDEAVAVYLKTSREHNAALIERYQTSARAS